jgi:hypothetical protein
LGRLTARADDIGICPYQKLIHSVLHVHESFMGASYYVAAYYTSQTTRLLGAGFARPSGTTRASDIVICPRRKFLCLTVQLYRLHRVGAGKSGPNHVIASHFVHTLHAYFYFSLGATRQLMILRCARVSNLVSFVSVERNLLVHVLMEFCIILSPTSGHVTFAFLHDKHEYRCAQYQSKVGAPFPV